MENNTAKVTEGIFNKPWVQSLTGIIIIVLVCGGILFWKSSTSRISIDNSEISATPINISTDTAGTLDQVYVHEGDTVLANAPLARVGTQTITSQVSGVVLTVDNEIGKTIAPGETIVTLINPNDLRVVGQIDENKGLSDIKVGQPATFTVDAFGGHTYTGIVDQVSPTSNQSGVAFSISDKRETKQFNVSIQYNVALHPEFKNGMSAKITIYK